VICIFDSTCVLYSLEVQDGVRLNVDGSLHGLVKLLPRAKATEVSGVLFMLTIYSVRVPFVMKNLIVIFRSGN
jgi:hypothetical protein